MAESFPNKNESRSMSSRCVLARGFECFVSYFWSPSPPQCSRAVPDPKRTSSLRQEIGGRVIRYCGNLPVCVWNEFKCRICRRL